MCTNWRASSTTSSRVFKAGRAGRRPQSAWAIDEESVPIDRYFGSKEDNTIATMSEFWTRKMKTYFNRIDFDKDGSITRKDFEGMGERFVEADKLDATAGAAMKSKLVEVSALEYDVKTSCVSSLW